MFLAQTSKKGKSCPRPPNFENFQIFWFTQIRLTYTLPKCPQRPTEVMSNSNYGKLSFRKMRLTYTFPKCMPSTTHRSHVKLKLRQIKCFSAQTPEKENDNVTSHGDAIINFFFAKMFPDKFQKTTWERGANIAPAKVATFFKRYYQTSIVAAPRKQRPFESNRYFKK